MRRDTSARTVRLANGLALSYVAQGDPAGPTVLMLHPWGESLNSFDRLLPLVPESIHVLAMDMRGHGAADKPSDGYALTDFADDVTAFMDAMEVSSAVLVGSSSGGYVAQQIAVTDPKRVTGLVLVGAPRSLKGRPAFADEVDRLEDPVDRAWVSESLLWFPRFHDVPDWYLQERIDDGVRMPAHVWRKALEGLTSATPPVEVATITAPTLILWGDRDELLSWEDEVALSTEIPSSLLVVYEKTGHLVLWEQPERVAQDLSDFIESLGDQPPGNRPAAD